MMSLLQINCRYNECDVLMSSVVQVFKGLSLTVVVLRQIIISVLLHIDFLLWNYDAFEKMRGSIFDTNSFGT